MRQRVLFVCRRPPWPLTNGARIRSHRLLTGLSEHFDVVLLTMDHHPDGPDAGPGGAELQRLLPDVEVHTVPGLGRAKRPAQLASLPRRRSWSFGRYATGDLRRAVDRLVADRGIELVHADDLGAAQVLPSGGPVTVYSSHNVEHEIVCGDAHAAEGFVHRAFAAVDCRKLRSEEVRVWRGVDLTLAVSPHDAEVMRSAGAPAVELCPNGTDPAEPRPLRQRAPAEPLRALFVGSGAYGPYERGLSWFCRRVLPQVRARMPMSFDVVGQPPRHPVDVPGVTYHGYVDEVGSWYERADLVVVPVHEGSGTRLKLVEAAAHGRPIVTTALGAQGLPLEPDVHYLRAEDEPGFVEAIGRVAAGGDDLHRMVREAREAVTPLFWPNITEDLCHRYRSLITQRSGAGP